jgi:hypothetical protein
MSGMNSRCTKEVLCDYAASQVKLDHFSLTLDPETPYLQEDQRLFCNWIADIIGTPRVYKKFYKRMKNSII